MNSQFKFRHHKYTYSNPYGSPYHNWELVGPNGGINFHVSMLKGYPPSCGLEFHAITNDGGEAPSQLQCHLTGGRCWHDGTSMYASETVWPRVQRLLENGDHEAVFRMLESEYVDHFENKDTP